MLQSVKHILVDTDVRVNMAIEL